MVLFGIGPTVVLIEPYGSWPRRPQEPSPGDADSDSTAGSASADLTAVGTASAATAERNRTSAVRGVLRPLGLHRPTATVAARVASGPSLRCCDTWRGLTDKPCFGDVACFRNAVGMGRV